MKYLVFIFLLSIGTRSTGQILQGRVVDEVSGTGIPFASIGILGTNDATISNESGDFILKINRYPTQLRVTHVSYLQADLAITEKQERLIIRLKPATISLTEVTIDPYRAQRIVKSALEKAKSAIVLDFYTKAFYRQLTAVNDEPSQIYELFYDLKWSTRGVRGWSASQSRFAEAHGKIEFSFYNQSYLTFLFSGYLLPEKNGKFVTISTLADYEIAIERYIEQVDQKIAVISCKYKVDKKKTYYVNSTYYVGMDDLKIYRLENSIFNLPMKFSYASPKFSPVVSTVATFNGIDHPVAILESVSTKFFVALKGNGSEFKVSTSSLLTAYELDNSLKNIDFETPNSKTKDKKVIESITYDPSFWKDNPIVRQTSLEDAFIKMMESKSAFGTMTNP